MKWLYKKRLPKIGLVLNGGGARGPYQIGVYLALKKFGLTQKVVGMSGSSVGAFMETIFLYDDPKKIVNFWNKINNDIIMQTKNNKVSALAKALSGKQGFFSRENLTKVVNSNIDLRSLLFSANIPVFVSLAKQVKNNDGKVESYEPEYVLLNGLPSEDILTLLLATSAIPYVFDPVKYKDNYYVDPMKADNEPVKPLMSLDMDMLFIVPLNVSHYNHHYDSSFPKTIVDFASPKMMDLPRMNMINFSQDMTNGYISEGYQVGKLILTYMKDNNLLRREEKKEKLTMPKKYISLHNMGIENIEFAKMKIEDIFKDIERGEN